MSKSREELKALKEEVESANEKLAELTPEEIAQVSGGVGARVHVTHIEAGAELGSERVSQEFPGLFDPKNFVFGQIGAGN